MIDAVLFSTDNQFPDPDERVAMRTFKNEEEFLKEKEYCYYFDDGASHSLIKLDKETAEKFKSIERRFQFLMEKEQLKLFNSIDFKM
jgi:hypothetical protein